MKWLKKIFGVKDKVEEKPSKSYIPKDLELEERKISPLLTEEKQSVPIEENIMDIVQPEEPIAPSLERQDEIKIPYDSDKYKIDYKEMDEKSFDGKRMDRYLGDEFGQWQDVKKEETEWVKKQVKKLKDDGLLDKKKKSTKPKKQAKKKDKFNDDASKPKGNNFLM